MLSCMQEACTVWYFNSFYICKIVNTLSTKDDISKGEGRVMEQQIRIGDVLVGYGYLTQQQLDMALNLQKSDKSKRSLIVNY